MYTDLLFYAALTLAIIAILSVLTFAIAYTNTLTRRNNIPAFCDLLDYATLIKDNLIEVNKRQYSMILELNSISYELLHEQEKNTVDSELISISQMIKFPFQFLMIKQGINTKTSIEKIETSIVSIENVPFKFNFGLYNSVPSSEAKPTIGLSTPFQFSTYGHLIIKLLLPKIVKITILLA